MLLSLHHLFRGGASDLYCDSLWEDVSCSCNKNEYNSKSPHLEQARSLGHILTFTPGSCQINSIHCSRFSGGPAQLLSHLSSQPDTAYRGSSMSTVVHYHIKWDSECILCHSMWPEQSRAAVEVRLSAVCVHCMNTFSLFGLEFRCDGPCLSICLLRDCIPQFNSCKTSLHADAFLLLDSTTVNR